MWGLLCFVIWPYVPIVFAFITTVPLLANYMVSRKYYWSFANQIEYEYEENKYDISGNSQNRETYEDDKKNIEKGE